MKNLQKGFTLIELMIVVAIIAILAAIAVPAYQNYVIRSKISEGLSAADMARTAVGETFQTTGTIPGINASAGLPATKASLQSTYVSDLEVVKGVITVTIQGTNSDADNQTLVLTPYESDGKTALVAGYTGNITWKCTGSVPAKYLPASCR